MARRSNGCTACRHRRIRCDREWPSCRQCRVTDRLCSGPVQGFIFHEQTSAVTSRHSQRTLPSTCPSSSRRSSKGTATYCPALDILSLPSGRAISSAPLVSHFVTFLTPVPAGPPKRPWVTGVEDMAVAERGPALDASLRAAATAYCGVAARNHAVVMGGCAMYNEALSLHARAIAQRSGVPDAATICTTVILTIFETVWSASIQAYVAHLRAARKMLELASPEVVRHWLVREIALYVQYQSLLAMILAPEESSSPPEQPGLWEKLAQYQVDGTPSVTAPLILELFHLAKVFTCAKGNVSGTLSDLDGIGRRIEHLWANYHADAESCGEFIQRRHPHLGGFEYRDALTAITMALFGSARMLLSVVISAGDREESGEEAPTSQQIEQHAQAILDACSFLAPLTIGCMTLRMFFPLTLVALHSTAFRQRRMAREFLESWLSISMFSGLCRMINQRIKELSRGSNVIRV